MTTPASRYDGVIVKRDSLAFALAGTFFGLLVGWILGSQRAASPVAPAPVAQTAAPEQGAGGTEPTPQLDTARAATLERQANAEPQNAQVRTELANLYFDAKRYELAMPWYEAAFKLSPKDADISTDLGVCYYYLNQPDRALQQLDTSLAINPRHVKALFNQGVVRAFGKNDLAGAVEAWQKVVSIAPDSQEGKIARQGLDGIQNGHKADGAPPSGGRGSAGAGGSR